MTVAQGRKFAFSVGAALVVLGGISWWRAGENLAPALLTIGTLLVLSGLVAPTRLGGLYRAWMGLALLISRVTTPIIMALLFFGVILPVGLVMRLLGRNPLRHEAPKGSFWKKDRGGRGTMANQF